METWRWPRASQRCFLASTYSFLLVMLSPARAAMGPAQSPPAQPSSQAQSPASTNEDTLAEAARKNRAKKGNSAPPKVYTTDDVSTTAVSAAEKGCVSPGRLADAKIGKEEEECWRSKARELHYEIDAAAQEIDRLKDDIKNNGNSGDYSPTGGLQDRIYVADKNARLQKLQKVKEDTKKRLEQLKDEGLKAGTPEGWFR